jgi:DNA-binding HxlR family transcriptional regulator
MKQTIINTLEKMLKERERQNKYPVVILYTDLERKLSTIAPRVLKDTLRELRREKTIKAGRTINDTYIKLQQTT